MALLQGHSRQVAAVAFRPDGKRAVTASNDHSLRIWNLDVRYRQLEDAKCLVDVQQEVISSYSPLRSAAVCLGRLAATALVPSYVCLLSRSAIISLKPGSFVLLSAVVW